MTHCIKAVLFDADGVIQCPACDFHARVDDLLAPRCHEAEAFLDAVFAAEAPALTGHASFQEGLAPVLDRFQLDGREYDVLSLWTRIETDPGMLDGVARLRSAGMACYLATNQPAHRARNRSDTGSSSTRSSTPATWGS